MGVNIILTKGRRVVKYFGNPCTAHRFIENILSNFYIFIILNEKQMYAICVYTCSIQTKL